MKNWRTIPGFPDYSVSDHGDIRRDTPTKRNPSGGNILKPGVGKQGHQYVNLRANKKAHCKYVHRIVLEAFVGKNPEEKPCCAHRNGDPSDNRLVNLRWASFAENSQDSIAHGTSGRPGGTDHFRAKLDAEKMNEVLALYRQGCSLREIGRKLGLSHTTISAFLSGKSYRKELASCAR